MQIASLKINLLTNQILCREAIAILAKAAPDMNLKIDEYRIGTKLGGELVQRGANILFNDDDLALSIDDFSAKRLHLPMSELGSKMKDDGAFWGFELPLPFDLQSCRHTYSGLSLRMVTVKSERPNAHLARFDILYLTELGPKRD